jgi:hypothetical protein
MRHAVSVLLGIGFCLISYGPANAEIPQEPERSLYRHALLVCPNELLCACCTVFCPKPQPCIPCFSSRSCSKYCPKPFPCVPCFRSGCSANCYSPKPCPNLCRPLAADDYRCGEERTDCLESGAYDADARFAPAESYADDSHIQVD